MTQIKRRAADPESAPFEDVSLEQFDDLEHNHPRPIRQGRPRHKRACWHRPLGPGERARLDELERLGIAPRSTGGGS